MGWIGSGDKSRPVWMVTFTDLIALLLTFFVMLFAANQLQYDRWVALIESLSQSLSPDRGPAAEHPQASENARPYAEERAADLSYLEALLRRKAAALPELAGIRFRRGREGLVLSLPADRMFDGGSALPTATARTAVAALGSVLAHIGNAVAVHGHTDPVPVQRGVYRSNWELSIARAVAVADGLRRAGYARHIETLGFADTRFDEVPPGGSAALRNQRARRVELIVRPVRAAQ